MFNFLNWDWDWDRFLISNNSLKSWNTTKYNISAVVLKRYHDQTRAQKSSNFCRLRRVKPSLWCLFQHLPLTYKVWRLFIATTISSNSTTKSPHFIGASSVEKGPVWQDCWKLGTCFSLMRLRRTAKLESLRTIIVS